MEWLLLSVPTDTVKQRIDQNTNRESATVNPKANV